MPERLRMTPVIFNHSAAIDDFVATALLLTMPNIELLGVIVTNADCIAEPAGRRQLVFPSCCLTGYGLQADQLNVNTGA